MSIAVLGKGLKHSPGQEGGQERGRRHSSFHPGNKSCSVLVHPGCISTSSVFYLWD